MAPYQEDDEALAQRGGLLPPSVQGGLPLGASSPTPPQAPAPMPSFQAAPIPQTPQVPRFQLGGNAPNVEEMLAERLQRIQNFDPRKSGFYQRMQHDITMEELKGLSQVAGIRSQDRQLQEKNLAELAALADKFHKDYRPEVQENVRPVYAQLLRARADASGAKISDDVINTALKSPDLAATYNELFNDPLWTPQERQAGMSRLGQAKTSTEWETVSKTLRGEKETQALSMIQSALPQVVAQIRGPSQEPLDMQTFLTNPQVKQMLDQSPTLKRVFNAYVLDEKNAKTLERIGLATSLEGPPMTKELENFVGKMFTGPGGKPITNTPRLITSEMMKEASKAQMAFDIRKSAEAGLTTAQFMLTMPAPAKERMEHLDVNALVNSGDMISPPPKTTVGELRTGPYVHASDMQKKALTTLKPSRTAFSDMNALADRLITANTWQEAVAQGIRLHAGAFTGADSEAAAYRTAQPAVTSFLARLVESGVMTNEDIDRWKAAATASFFDTKSSNTIRRSIMSDVLNTAEQALISQVAGVSMKKPQALRELLNKMDQMTQETLKHTRAGLPPGARIIRGPEGETKVLQKGFPVPPDWKEIK